MAADMGENIKWLGVREHGPGDADPRRRAGHQGRQREHAAARLRRHQRQGDRHPPSPTRGTATPTSQGYKKLWGQGRTHDGPRSRHHRRAVHRHAARAPPRGRPRRPASAVPVVEIRGLSKTFGGVQALDDVGLTILPGEVHGLLGENGSGKSTLIKVLAGFHHPDSAEISIGGTPCRAADLAPGSSQLGLSFVHQDLGLLRELTVLENLRMIDFARRARGASTGAPSAARARETFARYGLVLDPTPSSTTSRRPIARCWRSCARPRRSAAVVGAGRRGLLVLDEPTVFLPREGVDRLFAIVREVAATRRQRAVRLARPRRGARDHRPRDRPARRARPRHRRRPRGARGPSSSR